MTNDVFTKRKPFGSDVADSRRGTKETELALAKLFRKHRVTGWRGISRYSANRICISKRACCGALGLLLGPHAQHCDLPGFLTTGLSREESACRRNPEGGVAPHRD